MSEETCTWKQEDEYGSWFYADCGMSFCFNDEGVKENGFIYCPKCGKKIVEQLWKTQEDEDE